MHTEKEEELNEKCSSIFEKVYVKTDHISRKDRIIFILPRPIACR